jgi:hypothetical protein
MDEQMRNAPKNIKHDATAAGDAGDKIWEVFPDM